MLARRGAILAFKTNIIEGDITHISSHHILREVEAALLERMRLTRRKAKAAVRLLERQSLVVEPKLIEKACRDPFDDYILAAALVGKVRYIVTADKDLLVLETYKGIKIIQSTEFAAILRR